MTCQDTHNLVWFRPMDTFYVISDVLGTQETGERRFVTGYWNGRELVEDMGEAKRYASVSDSEETLRDGKFYDPVVYEVESRGDALEVGKRFDFVNKYGVDAPD